MSLQLNEQFESWIGQTLNDASGHKVGKIEDIYTDDDTGQPEWLAVTIGHSKSDVAFVPMTEARVDGDDVQVPFPKKQVKEAPGAGADGKLSPEEEARIYAHYGYDYDEERIRLQREAATDRDRPTSPAGTDDQRGRWAEEEAAFGSRHESDPQRDRVDAAGPPLRR